MPNLPKIDESKILSSDIKSFAPDKTFKIFESTKNFWRTRTNVEFQVFRHLNADCLEVVCYNIDKEIECRLYLKESLLLQKISPSELEEKCTQKREEMTRKRLRLVNDEIVAEVQKSLCGNFIVSRATIQDAANNPEISSVEWEIVLMPQTGDSVIMAPNTNHEVLDIMLLEVPPNVEPVNVPRRKKTNASEFHALLGALRADSQKLNLAMDEASKMSGLAQKSVNSMNAFMLDVKNSRGTFDPCSMSIAKQRWLRAGRKVIIRNYTNSMRKRLERYTFDALPSVKKTTLERLPAGSPSMTKASSSAVLASMASDQRRSTLGDEFSNKKDKKNAAAAAGTNGKKSTMNSSSSTPALPAISSPNEKSSSGVASAGSKTKAPNASSNTAVALASPVASTTTTTSSTTTVNSAATIASPVKKDPKKPLTKEGSLLPSI